MKGSLRKSPKLARWSRRLALVVALSPVALGFGGCGADDTGTGPSKPGGGEAGSAPEVLLPEGASLFIEVRDTSGSPIPGASIFLVDKDQLVAEATADELGQVLLENLTPGRQVAQV